MPDPASSATPQSNGGPSGSPVPSRPRRDGLLPHDPGVLEEAAQRLRVLGHPQRLRLLELLAEKERPVAQLAVELGLEPRQASQHLSEMLRCGLVTRRQDGNFAVYSISDSKVLRGVVMLCASAVERRSRLADATSAEAG
jgi:DNA-binding transcriptional ArsR family regulator